MRRFGCALLLALCAVRSGANNIVAAGLDEWRHELASAGALVTNDIPAAYAQAQRLQGQLPEGATPADRVAVLNVLARAEVYLGMAAQANDHARQAIELANPLKDTLGEAEAQLNVGENFVNGGMELAALIASTTRSIALLDGVERPDLVGEALLQTSMMYLRVGQFDEAVTMAIQSMEIAARNKNPLALAYAHQGMLVALMQSGRVQEAGPHAAEMREQAHRAGSKLLEAQAIFSLGVLAQHAGDLRGAEALVRESLADYRTIGARYIEGQALYGLADLYRGEGRFDTALATLAETEALYSSYSNRLGIWYTLNARSDLELSLGRASAAIADAKHAYDLANAIDVLRYRSDSARRMATVLAARGNHQRAYAFSVEAATLTDQAARERASARLVEVTQRYESESRKREVAELVQRNQLQTAELKQRALSQRWLWTVLVAVVVTLAVTGYFLQRLRHTHRALERTFAELQRSRDHIEERKAAEAAREVALAEAERLANMRSEFLAQMSHELRTPLNGILGYGQILLADKSLNARQARGVGIIQQSGQHLLALINDILDLARIDAGKLELNTATIALPIFLSTVSEIIGVKADEKNLTFSYEAVALPAAVRGDDLRLRQVLLNLLSNAVKFTDRGQVSLRVTALESHDEATKEGTARVKFEVRDSGIGMSSAQLARLFHPFEQVAEGRRREGGAGLGLAISRQLVRLMGGDIEVHSEVDHGSTFIFELSMPLATSDARLASAADRGGVAGYDGPRKKVLVADDVEHNRAMLIDSLGALGFEVSEAANGQQALDSVCNLRPDLIVMDLSMPVMSGLEATYRIRLIPGLEHVPIIATSASATPQVEADSRVAGASDFIAKPIDQPALQRAIWRLLGLRSITPGQQPPRFSSHAQSDDMIIPPREEMQVLLALARAGNMRDIRQRADYLINLDPRYAPFSGRLRSLADNYATQAIVTLVERHSTG